MKLWQKITFIVVLAVFVAVSVTISLVSLSRAAYKYTEETAVGGNEGLNGWILYSFNGNTSTKELYIDFIRDGDGNNPDESKPIVGIRKYAVNADEYAEQMYIGASVQYIDETAFFNAKKLQRITVDPENQYYKDIDGVLYTKDGKVLLLYPICYGQKPTDNPEVFTYPDTYTVPEGVEHIASFAFLKNGNLRDLALPSTLKEIGDMTFFDCKKLGSYEYDPDTDSLIGTGFTLPDGIEKIGSDAFSKCANIAPVLYLPDSLKEVGHHAFFACAGMKDIFLAAKDEDSLILGDAWLPKNVKAGPAWKKATPQFGKSREDSEKLIEAFRSEKLDSLRKEAAENG